MTQSTEEPKSHSYASYARAFTIFAKYSDEEFGVQAEHDELFAGPQADVVSDEDKAELERLGWRPSDEGGFKKFT